MWWTLNSGDFLPKNPVFCDILHYKNLLVMLLILRSPVHRIRQKHVSLDCHCYSTLASVWMYCCIWSLACFLGNHTDNQHCPCTYWPGVFEGNDNVTISAIFSSSPSVVASVAQRLGVSPQDPCASWPKGAGSSWDDPGLVLLETRLEESVTLVPGWAALPSVGLEVTAVSSLQKSMWVQETTDLELEHPYSTYSLSAEGEGERQMTE